MRCPKERITTSMLSKLHLEAMSQCLSIISDRTSAPVPGEGPSCCKKASKLGAIRASAAVKLGAIRAGDEGRAPRRGRTALRGEAARARARARLRARQARDRARLGGGVRGGREASATVLGGGQAG